MSENLNFIISPAGVITVVANGRPYTADDSHPNYCAIYDLLRDGDGDEAELVDLMDIQKGVNAALENAGSGKAEVRNGVVYYDGEEVHNSVSKRILDLLSDGFDVGPLCKFLDNLMDNPSKQSVDELYDFLANTGLPITDDGCFLAYKGLRNDFRDIHSGTFDNSPGRTVSIRRNKVDDDRNRTCSYGLHVGAFSYASGFAGGGPVVLCKVNPKDVVSVPLDCGAQKCRTCSYEVLEQYHNSEELQKSLYKADGAEAEGRVLPARDGDPHNPDATDLELSVDYYLENYDKHTLIDRVRDIRLDALDLDECDWGYEGLYREAYDDITDDISDNTMIELATECARADYYAGEGPSL